jgi:hypothetical protein
VPTERIFYDKAERPERNRELVVVPVKEIPGETINGKETFYEGWGVMVPWDSRWAKKVDMHRSWFSAKIFSTTQVLITLPAYPFELYQCHKNFLTVGEGVPSYIVDGLDEAANEFDTHKDTRMMKSLLLEFERGTELSVTVLNKDARDGTELEMEIVPLKVEGRATAYACFVVARIDTGNAKRGKIDYALKNKSKEAELAEAFEDLGI